MLESLVRCFVIVLALFIQHTDLLLWAPSRFLCLALEMKPREYTYRPISKNDKVKDSVQ